MKSEQICGFITLKDETYCCLALVLLPWHPRLLVPHGFGDYRFFSTEFTVHSWCLLI